MKTKPSIRGMLYFFCILLGAAINTNAGLKVLFYGPTFETGSEAANLIADPSNGFDPIGSGSAVWTPGDPVASKNWSLKTTTDFDDFDVIVIGDLGSVQITNATRWAGALTNVNTWSSAINGNVIIFGGDPEVHAGPHGGGGEANVEGAKTFIKQAIKFAADDGQTGPGLYIALAAVNPQDASPADPSRKAVQHLLQALALSRQCTANSIGFRKSLSPHSSVILPTGT